MLGLTSVNNIRYQPIDQKGPEVGLQIEFIN